MNNIGFRATRRNVLCKKRFFSVRNERGFTLVEMLFVLAITMAIVVIAFSFGNNYIKDFRMNRFYSLLDMNLREIQAYSRLNKIHTFVISNTTEKSLEFFYYDSNNKKVVLSELNYPPSVQRIDFYNGAANTKDMGFTSQGNVRGSINQILLRMNGKNVAIVLGILKGRVVKIE